LTKPSKNKKETPRTEISERKKKGKSHFRNKAILIRKETR
jgi:hypothetical protein